MNETSWFITGALSAAIVVSIVSMLLRHRMRDKTTEERSERADSGYRQLAEPTRPWDILDHIAEGVVLLDGELRPAQANRSARTLLGLQTETLPRCLPSYEILAVGRRALAENSEVEQVVDAWFPARQSLRVHASPAEPTGGVILVLADITEELRTMQIRREFVAHASHELKSPVAGIQTLADAVRQAVPDDPVSAARFAARLSVEANRLGRLVSDLLDLSRLEHPADASEEQVDLSRVAQNQVTEIALEARSKQITLKQDVAKGVWVRGDEQQLGTMVRNLLENAVHYTPKGGRVSLDVYTEDGDAVVRVADNGIGIPKDAQARVFERFFRVDRARSRARGGTGLGLAIVKHVLELHKGSISLESEIGRGSTFTARLPKVLQDQRSLRPAAG